MSAFLQKHATLLLVLLALPALLIILGMTDAWHPAVAFTRALGLPATSLSGSPAPLGPAPDWTLSNLEGAPIRSADFKGRVVLVNFWATWCPPCVGEIPDFIRIQDEYRGRGLTILGISMDEGSADPVREFVKSHSINYPILTGSPEVAGAFGGIQGIPTSFLIDKTGQIVLRHAGAIDAASLRKALDPLLPP